MFLMGGIDNQLESHVSEMANLVDASNDHILTQLYLLCKCGSQCLKLCRQRLLTTELCGCISLMETLSKLFCDSLQTISADLVLVVSCSVMSYQVTNLDSSVEVLVSFIRWKSF